MSRRHDQVESTLLRAIQEVMGRGLADPRISGLITITSVELSADFKTCGVMVSVLPEDRQELVVHGLRDAARHIRREVGDIVDMKQVPDLFFKLDLSLKRQAAAYRAIAQAAAERELRGEAPDVLPTDENEEPGEHTGDREGGGAA
jgi:ribosome-binding factor A